jgi:hypothetical protein
VGLANFHELAASPLEALSSEVLSLARRSSEAVTCLVLALGCAQCVACAEAEQGGLPTTLDECGSDLGALLATESGAASRLDASYSDALADWTLGDESCGLGVFSGQCADGKRVLYRNGGFSSEIRYYEGEQLIGYVVSGDVGSCPSVCPFSRFYGSLNDVRCEAPRFDALCPRGPAPADGGALGLPFANGRAPGGCDL